MQTEGTRRRGVDGDGERLPDCNVDDDDVDNDGNDDINYAWRRERRDVENVVVWVGSRRHNDDNRDDDDVDDDDDGDAEVDGGSEQDRRGWLTGSTICGDCSITHQSDLSYLNYV